jgi:putative oxidoreductase
MERGGTCMTGLLSRLESHAYALLRIVGGLLFLFHGLQKVFGMYGGKTMPLMSLAWFAGVIELVAGVLVMVGLFAAPAAFIASGEMAYAYFTVHQPQGTWPIQNDGELAALYCFIFLYVATRGSGIWSVDWLRGHGGRGRR